MSEPQNVWLWLLSDNWVSSILTVFLLVSAGSKSTPSGRGGAAEKKERRVSAEEEDKPQKPRE